jgi:hypothetical protein
MKLLIKYPTKYRLQKSIDVLKKYIDLADDMSQIKVIVSLDKDDNESIKRMKEYSQIHKNIEVCIGEPNGKIGAINRDIPDVSTFDILLLASDDMIPVVKGYDTIIRDSMQQFYPDTDGVLFFNDGYVGYRTNTLVICGSKYYQRFGYVYCPEYKSLFCDNEFTDEANRLGKQKYLDIVIIKHEHPSNNSNIVSDGLYNTNDEKYKEDEKVYIRRFKPLYDISVLICTIPNRHEQFMTLLDDIENHKKNTDLRIQVLFDSRTDISIGKKRNDLLNRATGNYVAFIDDDDKITPDYFKVVKEAIESGDYDSISLIGRYYINNVYQRTFYHSIKYDEWFDDKDGYYRPPNHLNPIKNLIVRQIMFSDMSHGEDKDFSMRLKEKELIKSEYVHDNIQYLYYKIVEVSVPPPVILTSTRKLENFRWKLKI